MKQVKSAYKCIFSDIDRTLLNSSGQLSGETGNAIKKISDMGIPFILATGRAFNSLPAALTKLSCIRYCITSNGVALYDIQEKKPLFRTLLPKGFVSDFFDLCETEGLIALEIYIDGQAYTCRKFFEDPARFNQQRVEYVQSTRKPVEDLKAFALSKDGELDGVTIISPKGRLNELLEKATKRFGNEVYITSSDELYIEMSNKECGKQNALIKTCEYLGIKPEDAVAFGDNNNDSDMLKAAGLGICVANGTPECKTAAGMLTESNDDDGVAKALYRLFNLR